MSSASTAACEAGLFCIPPDRKSISSSGDEPDEDLNEGNLTRAQRLLTPTPDRRPLLDFSGRNRANVA